jgi:hypothetical protein
MTDDTSRAARMNDSSKGWNYLREESIAVKYTSEAYRGNSPLIVPIF